MKTIYRLLFLALLCLFVPEPVHAHLPAQLFQGAELHESGVIRAIPPGFDPEAFPRMPGGLYRIPPLIKVEVELLSGAHRGERVSVDYYLGGNPTTSVFPRVGERVIIGETRMTDGSMLYQMVEYDRRPTLAWLTVLSALTILLIGRKAGLWTLAILGGGGLLLYAVILPILLNGAPPVLIVGLVAFAVGVWAAILALPRGSAERPAAFLGVGSGLLVATLVMLATFTTGHVTGLATADALVLYSQIMTARDLDYRQLWLAGTLLTALGGLIAASVMTARAIARHPHEDPWVIGMREGRSLLPALALATGLLYFGISLPLLLISHLGVVTSIRISMVRWLNYDYLVSVILAWESGLLGLVASMLITAWSARILRKRQPSHAP